MKPAIRPRDPRDQARLVVLDPAGDVFQDGLAVTDLPEFLRPGDLLVVNDAATLPASLSGHTAAGAPIELRLAAGLSGDDNRWQAAVLGAGDYQTPTEHRPPPPALAVGQRLTLGPLAARVVQHLPISPRLVEIEFEQRGEAFWSALYAHGKPVQYAHVPEPLELWSVQTAYAGPPVALEMPSAGRPLSWSVLLSLRQKGVAIAALTHAAGLSATGDPAIDDALPLAERYFIPETTALAIASCKQRHGRVIAVGTSVVRALESATSEHGEVCSGPGIATLIIEPEHAMQTVDGLLTGLHGPEESHYGLLSAFAPTALLSRAWRHVASLGYTTHEFGDVALLLSAL